MKFLEKQTAIVEEIRSKLAKIIKPEAVDFGKYGEKPMHAPFILVYLEPDEMTSLENRRNKSAKCKGMIACGSEVLKHQHLSNAAAIELAHLAKEAVESLPNITPIGKIEPAGVYNGSSVAIFEFTTSYEAPKIQDYENESQTP